MWTNHEVALHNCRALFKSILKFTFPLFPYFFVLVWYFLNIMSHQHLISEFKPRKNWYYLRETKLKYLAFKFSFPIIRAPKSWCNQFRICAWMSADILHDNSEPWTYRSFTSSCSCVAQTARKQGYTALFFTCVCTHFFRDVQHQTLARENFSLFSKHKRSRISFSI